MDSSDDRPDRGPGRGTGGRTRTVVLACAATLVVVLAAAWWLRDDSVSLDLEDLGAARSGTEVVAADDGGTLGPVRSAETAAVLARAQQALDDGDGAALVDLAGSSPRSEAVMRQWADNAAALGLEDVSMRFVAGAPVARDRWEAEVEVGFRDPTAGAQRVRVSALVTLADLGGRSDPSVVVVGAGGDGGRTPLWMSSALTVREQGRVSVRVADGSSLDPARVVRLGDTALRQVARTLPGWRGPLVLEVPPDTRGVAHVLGEPEGAYDAVAAITTTMDGSAGERAPVHVVVNPAVLGTLGNRGEQVVLTHEAVHVATRAATSPGLPLWLMEGFADWAALRVTDLPDRVAAGALLRQVREQGPPGRLPGELEFDPGGAQFGVSYEAAWLAVRLMAEEYGPAAAVRFYDRIDDGAGVAQAFEQLGTTEAAFTARWQRYLERLAGVDDGGV